MPPSRPPDAIALLAVPLVVLGFWTDGIVVPTICLCLAWAAVVYVITGHDELSRRRRVVICVLVTAVDVGMLAYFYKVNLAMELRKQSAPLIAATLPSPVSSNCPIPRGAVALYLGNMVSVVTEFPHVIFKVGKEHVLVVDRDGSGVLVSFAAYDDSGNIVGRMNRNVFRAINSASHVERPSPSNLIVFGDSGTKVLDLEFLNPQAIKVTGVLRYPGVEPIVISEKYLGIGGAISPPACRSGNGVEFLLH